MPDRIPKFENEPELVEASRQGNRHVFKQIYDIYRERVYSLAYYMCKNIETAENLLGQVFCGFPVSTHVSAQAVNSLFIFDVNLLEGTVVPAFAGLDEFRLIFYTLNLRRHGFQNSVLHY